MSSMQVAAHKLLQTLCLSSWGRKAVVDAGGAAAALATLDTYFVEGWATATGFNWNNWNPGMVKSPTATVVVTSPAASIGGSVARTPASTVKSPPAATVAGAYNAASGPSQSPAAMLQLQATVSAIRHAVRTLAAVAVTDTEKTALVRHSTFVAGDCVRL